MEDMMVSVANVVSVSASVPNGGYRAGDTIWVDVTFTESVFVNTAGGIPSLQMSSSGSAVYTRGSGSEVLTFSYTVPAGANSIDLDYSSTNALMLNGATIVNSAMNNAGLTLASPGTAGSLGANSNIVIDTTAPTNTIASFAFSADTGNSQTDFITKTASQTISGTLSANLAEGENVYVSLDNGATWTIATTAVGTSAWSLAGQTLASSHTLQARVLDLAGNSGTSASQHYTLDITSPTVSSVAVPADATYEPGQNLDFTVNASETITVDTTGGTPRIALVVGATTAYANYVSGSGSSALLFRYTVQAGDQDANGITVGALTSNGASLHDTAGNNMVTTLNSVASTAGVNVNGLAPVFTGASVNGNSLVISYFAATSLDSINIPDLSAYHVTADGAANAVTAIVIDAAAKTATLTLATAVTAGQAVTIAYTDPTSGNDPHALQSSTGEDAASLAATLVTNNTLAPTAPTHSGGSGVVNTAPEKGGVLNGTIYGDILTGLAGKDTFYPGGGADSIDGGDNVDTVVFSGARGQYTLTHNSDGTYTVRDMLDPSVSVAMKNIERVNFSDQALAIDATPESARLAELYHLALGRKPDDAGLQYHLGVSNSGATTSQIIAAFVASSEFASGQGQLSDNAFLTQLYGNAFDRSPDAGGFAYWMQQLAHAPGPEGRAQVMEGFLASSEMTLQITGQVDSGIALLLQA
jgi:uncharacterized repeat protein (TIGR02059 family)